MFPVLAGYLCGTQSSGEDRYFHLDFDVPAIFGFCTYAWEYSRIRIADNPLKFLRLRVKSAVFFWTGQNVWHAYAWAPEHPVTAPLNLLLFFFAAAGVGVAVVRKERSMRLIFIVLGTFPIPYYLCHSDIQYRYRMPMDPFLILLGALAIAAALEGKRDDG